MPGASTLGRPKRTAREPVKAPSPDDRPTIINLKGTNEYAEWLEAVYRKTHLPKATIFRVAVAEWAERNGHPKPPEL